MGLDCGKTKNRCPHGSGGEVDSDLLILGTEAKHKTVDILHLTQEPKRTRADD